MFARTRTQAAIGPGQAAKSFYNKFGLASVYEPWGSIRGLIRVNSINEGPVETGGSDAFICHHGLIAVVRHFLLLACKQLRNRVREELARQARSMSRRLAAIATPLYVAHTTSTEIP